MKMMIRAFKHKNDIDFIKNLKIWSKKYYTYNFCVNEWQNIKLNFKQTIYCLFWNENINVFKTFLAALKRAILHNCDLSQNI